MQKVLLAAIVMLMLLLGGTAWVASVAIAWARDLPNRITFEFEGESIGNVITGATRLGIQAEDAKMQLEIIRGLAQMSQQDPMSIAWIDMEFIDELTMAAASPSTDVAAAASELLERIDAGTN